jgi:hypothetical protein
MSKRVLILFGVGVLLLVGALFLLKYELSTQPEEITEEEPEAQPEPEPKPKRTKAAPVDLPINKTLSDETGTETTN